MIQKYTIIYCFSFEVGQLYIIIIINLILKCTLIKNKTKLYSLFQIKVGNYDFFYFKLTSIINKHQLLTVWI